MQLLRCHTASFYHHLEQLDSICRAAELMLSMKGTFERQYARDKLIDILYSEQRRVRRAVPGPADGYYHRK